MSDLDRPCDRNEGPDMVHRIEYGLIAVLEAAATQLRAGGDPRLVMEQVQVASTAWAEFLEAR